MKKNGEITIKFMLPDKLKAEEFYNEPKLIHFSRVKQHCSKETAYIITNLCVRFCTQMIIYIYYTIQ